MSILTKALSAIGLMRVSEHEATCRPLRERLFDSEQKRIHWQGEANEANAKFKQAITDLEAKVRECDGWKAAALAMEPDALKWRDYLKRSRDRKAAKKEGGL